MTWPSSCPGRRPHRRVAPGRATPYHLWPERRASGKGGAGTRRSVCRSGCGTVGRRALRMCRSCSIRSHSGSDSSTTYAISSSVVMIAPPIPAHLLRMSCQRLASSECRDGEDLRTPARRPRDRAAGSTPELRSAGGRAIGAHAPFSLPRSRVYRVDMNKSTIGMANTHDGAAHGLGGAFHRLAWSNLTAQSAEQVALAAAPMVAVLALGAGGGDNGLLAPAQSAPLLLLSFPLGVLADRVSRRRLMTMAEAFRALALAALPLLALQGWMSVSALAAIGFAAATGTVAFSVAAPALVPALVPREAFAAAN